MAASNQEQLRGTYFGQIDPYTSLFGSWVDSSRSRTTIGNNPQKSIETIYNDLYRCDYTDNLNKPSMVVGLIESAVIFLTSRGVKVGFDAYRNDAPSTLEDKKQRILTLIEGYLQKNGMEIAQRKYDEYTRDLRRSLLTPTVADSQINDEGNEKLNPKLFALGPTIKLSME